MSELKIDPAEYVSEDEALALRTFSELNTIAVDALPTMRARLAEWNRFGMSGRELGDLAKEISMHESNQKIFNEIDADIAARRDGVEAIHARAAIAETEVKIQNLVDKAKVALPKDYTRKAGHGLGAQIGEKMRGRRNRE